MQLVSSQELKGQRWENPRVDDENQGEEAANVVLTELLKMVQVQPPSSGCVESPEVLSSCSGSAASIPQELHACSCSTSSQHQPGPSWTPGTQTLGRWERIWQAIKGLQLESPR